MELSRSIVKAHILDADRIFVLAGKPYVCLLAEAVVL